MEVKFYTLLKVDNTANTVTKEDFTNTQNVKDYILELISNCVDSQGDREYNFEPTLSTTQNHIKNIISGNSREEECKALGEKLLHIEKETQAKIKHLKNEIPKGMLMISFAKMTDNDYKFLITKADYSEFLEELSGDKRSGLPTKKKIFKSFIMNLSSTDGVTYKYDKIITYDSNTSNKAAYWWKNFLELKEIRNDEINTKHAYDAIKKRIIEPLKNKHKQDYLYLRNATIAYFRTDGDFDINHYKDVIIGSYHPFDSSLDINGLKSKITELPKKEDFDNTFPKVPKIIKDKFKDVIKLTDEIELKLKQDIINLERVIKPHKDDQGNKYIMILSQEGYQYAEGLTQDKNE